MSPRERQLIEEIEKLRQRLAEPESTIEAIRQGEVDAFVVSGPAGEKVYTFHPADPPYRRIVEEMKEGAATFSTDGTILYANRRLGEMLKADAAQLRSRSLRDFVARDHARTFDRLLVGSEGGRAEIAFRASDGSVFPASVAASAFRDEDVTAFSIVVTDLTEQKASAELAAAEAAWREADRRKDWRPSATSCARRSRRSAAPRRSSSISVLPRRNCCGRATWCAGRSGTWRGWWRICWTSRGSRRERWRFAWRPST
jgi:PAS domain S-box-containing protein